MSCLRKNCNNIRSSLTSSPSIKPLSSVSAPRKRMLQRKRTRSIKEDDAEDHRPQTTDEQPMEVDQDTASVTGSVRGRSKRKAETERTQLRTRSTDSRKLRSSSKASTTRRAASVSAKPKSRVGRKSVTKNEEESTVTADAASPKKRRKVV